MIKEPWHLIDTDVHYIVGHEQTEERAIKAAELASLNTGHSIDVFKSENKWVQGSAVRFENYG